MALDDNRKYCGTCYADETWCWMFTVNEGQCPCANCSENDDCLKVLECKLYNNCWED